MDSFFGIGFAEFALILILAGVVLGPKQMRDVARQLGYWSAYFQRMYRAFMAQINQELDALDDETMQEVRTIGKQVQSLQRDMKQSVNTLWQQSKDSIDEADQTIKTTIKNNAQNGTSMPAKSPPPTAPPPPKPIDIEGDPAK